MAVCGSLIATTIPGWSRRKRTVEHGPIEYATKWLRK
jgi:hypothetical protein